MSHIIHLIPFYGIGGVERAAQSMDEADVEGELFSIQTIFPGKSVPNKLILWNPDFYIITIFRILINPPKLLVVSL